MDESDHAQLRALEDQLIERKYAFDRAHAGQPIEVRQVAWKAFLKEKELLALLAQCRQIKRRLASRVDA